MPRKAKATVDETADAAVVGSKDEAETKSQKRKADAISEDTQPRRSSRAKKPRVLDNVDSREEEDEVPATKKTKKQKVTGKKKAVSKTADKDDAETDTKKPAKRASKKKSPDAAATDDAKQKTKTSPAKKAAVKQDKPKKTASKKAAPKPSAISAAEKKKIAEAKEDLASSSIDELKSQLRVNDQIVSGTKGDLIARVAEGQVLGAIPRCPSCSGGRPKFDAISGVYKCPGYRDDEDFVRCSYRTTDLKRNPWVSA